jgi:hypothetical protein
MSRPDVIVSSGGPYHAYHLVRGAQRAGYLRRFITGYLRHEQGIDRPRPRVVIRGGSGASAVAFAWCWDTLFFLCSPQ